MPAALLLAIDLADAQQSAEQVDGQAAADAVVEPPIIIDSDSNQYDLRTGLTRFSDNVRIQRGAMEVNADEGVVHQTDGRYTLIELFGSPTTWRDRLDDGSVVAGSAAQIRYDVTENVVRLTGNARLTHEQGEFTGEELTYDLDTESLTGRGTSGNQARVVLEGDSIGRNGSDDRQAGAEEAEDAQPEAPSDPEARSDAPPDDNSDVDADTDDPGADADPVDGTQDDPDRALPGEQDSEQPETDEPQPVDPPANR